MLVRSRLRSSLFLPSLNSIHLTCGFGSPASVSTTSQPKSLAVGEDNSVFVAEIGRVEVVRDNQKITSSAFSFNPSSVATYGGLVGVGGEVRRPRYPSP